MSRSLDGGLNRRAGPHDCPSATMGLTEQLPGTASYSWPYLHVPARQRVTRAVSPRVTWDLPVDHGAQAKRPSNPSVAGSNLAGGAEQHVAGALPRHDEARQSTVANLWPSAAPRALRL